MTHASSELLFHHYSGSPFSEKVRLVFGFKSIDWRSVTVPMILPKPDVMALTGGYRRTPFLQIGADIYCDTALICQLLDGMKPEPPLYPASAGGVQHVVAQWADSALFWAAVPYTMQAAGPEAMLARFSGDQAKAFAADRAAMTTGRVRVGRNDNAAQLQNYFAWLDTQLWNDQPFLLGAQASIADFSAAQSVWYMRNGAAAADLLKPFSKLNAWYERVHAFGHGSSQPLTAEEAIAIAAATKGHAPTAVEAGFGFDAGAAVTISATDYATDPVAGTLVGLNTTEAVIERQDERAGTLHVHFPRIGYQVRKAEH
jgi:glutathione S-transferase